MRERKIITDIPSVTFIIYENSKRNTSSKLVRRATKTVEGDKISLSSEDSMIHPCKAGLGFQGIVLRKAVKQLSEKHRTP